MKILFCCHYAGIHNYFLSISRLINSYDSEVIDLKSIEKNFQHLKYNRKTPWRALWLIARFEKNVKRHRNSALSLKTFLQRLPFYFFLRSLLLFRAYHSVLKEKSPDAVCIWGGRYHASLLTLAARTQNIAVVFLENGALPYTTAVDLQGINANNSVPRDAEFYRMLPAAPELDFNNSLEIRKTRAGKPGQDAGIVELPLRYIFVPFQVDSDTQILLQSPWVRDMRQFFRLVVKAFKQLNDPQLHLIFKEHPSSRSKYPDLHDEAGNEARIHFVNNRLTQELIEHAESVVTINSGVGIESLLLDRPVIVVGRAFYKIPDLVLSAESESELLHQLKSVSIFQSDQLLRRNFLHYLKTECLVSGKKLSMDESHLKAVATRISLLLETKKMHNALLPKQITGQSDQHRRHP